MGSSHLQDRLGGCPARRRVLGATDIGVKVCRDETVITGQERSGLVPKVTRINSLPDLDSVVVV